MATFGSYAANATIDIGAAGQTPGTATNDSASAGNVGEVMEATVPSSSPVSLLTTQVTNVAFLTLTAGDWDVGGIANFKYTGATQTADGVAGVTTTSVTLPTDGGQGYNNTRQTTTTSNASITIPKRRVSASGSTNVYLVAQATFSAGSCGGFGVITARRVR